MKEDMGNRVHARLIRFTRLLLPFDSSEYVSLALNNTNSVFSKKNTNSVKLR
jgi:hypothetical protein